MGGLLSCVETQDISVRKSLPKNQKVVFHGSPRQLSCAPLILTRFEFSLALSDPNLAFHLLQFQINCLSH